MGIARRKHSKWSITNTYRLYMNYIEITQRGSWNIPGYSVHCNHCIARQKVGVSGNQASTRPKIQWIRVAFGLTSPARYVP